MTCAERAHARMQVNKPYLPLASGEISQAMGQGIVLLSGVLALALGASCCASSMAHSLPGSLGRGAAHGTGF